MKVESSFGTLDQILGSKRPVNAFMQAKNSGAIKITSLNAFTGAKVTLGEFFASIYSFFEPN
jgi:hypothetical protein